VKGVYVFENTKKDVDGRDKPGHDDKGDGEAVRPGRYRCARMNALMRGATSLRKRWPLNRP
jgi:hypothetical protein